MGYAIKTEGLTKTYKDKVAVDGLTLSVNEGELIALLGVNGAGKTTTVRAVGTLEELEARTGKKGLEEVFVSIAEA